MDRSILQRHTNNPDTDAVNHKQIKGEKLDKELRIMLNKTTNSLINKKNPKNNFEKKLTPKK